MSSVIMDRKTERFNGDGGKDNQRKNIMSALERHIKVLQEDKNVGRLVVELESVRGGNLKSPYIEYTAKFRFLEKIDGLG